MSPEHRNLSKALVDDLLRLEVELQASSDRQCIRQLNREIRAKRQQFANHLTTPSKGTFFTYSDGVHTVTPFWRVDGVPSRRGKTEAARWMAERGLEWGGSAPPLREEALVALNHGETLPAGNFGLFVEWTVRVETDECLSKSLLNLTTALS